MPEETQQLLPLREAHCRECVNWFLGCLNGREKWKDKAVTPNYRRVRLQNGETGGLCDAFEWDPNPHRHGRVVWDEGMENEE